MTMHKKSYYEKWSNGQLIGALEFELEAVCTSQQQADRDDYTQEALLIVSVLRSRLVAAERGSGVPRLVEREKKTDEKG